MISNNLATRMSTMAARYGRYCIGQPSKLPAGCALGVCFCPPEHSSASPWACARNRASAESLWSACQHVGRPITVSSAAGGALRMRIAKRACRPVVGAQLSPTPRPSLPGRRSCYTTPPCRSRCCKPPVVAVVTFLGGLQLVGIGIIGIIGEYLRQSYIESNRRPIYLIRRVYRQRD